MKQYKNIWPIKHKHDPKVPDARYSVTLEFCGREKPYAVFRFCDEWVSTHKTRNEAIEAAKTYQSNFYKES